MIRRYQAQVNRALREPLFHFLLLGGGMFMLFGLGEGSDKERSNEVIVSAGKIDQLAAIWRKTWQRPPTVSELDGLIEDYLMEEVLYREAMAMGLDRDDTIIRRRLRQKMDFLIEDFDANSEPSNAELESYLASNLDRFKREPRVSFRHVYLNADQRGDAVAKDAEIVLASLKQVGSDHDPEIAGDSLLLPSVFDEVRSGEVARLFGNQFTDNILALEPGQWLGPIESSYGLHLVYVSKRTNPSVPKLDDIRDSVKTEWQYERRQKMRAESYNLLKARYAITVEHPEWYTTATKLAPEGLE